MKLKFAVDENDVKKLVLKWFKKRLGWSYAPIQNGLGAHGIPDRVGCVPVKITPEMVGKTIGVFVAIESKRPGRRGEALGGATGPQVDQLRGIISARGMGSMCDSQNDLDKLDRVFAHMEAGHDHAQTLTLILNGRTGTNG
jgi:hypothetical protein